MEECIDLTYEKDFDELTGKMINQVKRIIELPDVSFKALVNILKQDTGEEVAEVLQQIYQEKNK